MNHFASLAIGIVGASAALAQNDVRLDALKGEVIRLEFMIKNADLYSFRASGETP